MFNIFTEEAIETGWITMKGKSMHFIRFAEDIPFGADLEGNMGMMLQSIKYGLEKFNLRINSMKTVFLTVRNNEIRSRLSVYT